VACNLAAFAFCARATGTALPLAAILALVPLILLTMVLPLTIGGWGLREGAAAALFPLAGASAAAGLATSIAFGLMLLVSVLPGLVALWPVPRARADPRP
jgi:glycosyltransferase 2 family protein